MEYLDETFSPTKLDNEIFIAHLTLELKLLKGSSEMHQLLIEVRNYLTNSYSLSDKEVHTIIITSLRAAKEYHAHAKLAADLKNLRILVQGDNLIQRLENLKKPHS